MPWFDDFLKTISRALAGSAHSPGRRTVAAALSVMLLLASLAPGVAFAGEVDSESEGTAPPGVVEGGPDPGGEESVLEDVPGAIVGGGSADTDEGPPLESEPSQESEPPPVPVEPQDPEATPLPESEQAPVGEAPSAAEAPAPEYGPTYETAPLPPSSEPIENQPLTAPESLPPAGQERESAGVEQAMPEEPPPSAPREAPEPEPAPPAAIPRDRHDLNVSLAGRRVHVIQAGECLWSIAEALLPAGVGNAEIAAEVGRLWSLNAARVGTGNPNLLYTGTALTLR